MRRTLAAALMWLAVLGPGFAKADPLLTPLVSAALLGGGVPIIGGGSIGLASIVSYTITAGPAHGKLTVIR